MSGLVRCEATRVEDRSGLDFADRFTTSRLVTTGWEFLLTLTPLSMHFEESTYDWR
jgi:hypothetical protein